MEKEGFPVPGCAFSALSKHIMHTMAFRLANDQK
jgi:hypothetical protein